MTPELRAKIEAMGVEFTPGMVTGTQALYAETFPGLSPETRVERDVFYGPHERHRLDVFTREGMKDAPVLIFVHGGGFVRGDKRSDTLPFYDNIGEFAVGSGYVGVTITHRLAPDNPWPAGAEDVAGAVAWVRANIAAHGGSPRKIFLMGQSAGAVHAASYVAHTRFHPEGGDGLAGALLISSIYDIATAHANPFHKAYFGEDASGYPACSTTEGLLATSTPLLMSVSEFDVPDFQKQAADMAAAWKAARGLYPPMVRLTGHNHMSPVLSLGGPDDSLAREVVQFIDATAA
jgi:acetyl esterase/lipase